MPRLPSPVIQAALCASACSPTSFAWQDPPPHIEAYRQSFADAAGQRLDGIVPRDELLREIASSRVLWIGDHHRHSRLHGLHLELLGQLANRQQTLGRPIALGLEAIGTDDQAAVDEFLAGGTTLQQLRRAAKRRWAGSWLDDRELDPFYFRSLLGFAQRRSMPVFALEPTPRLPLAARDDYMARSITAAAERWPDRLLVVIVGQSHLLGDGDLVARCGLGGVVIGANPSAMLRASRAEPADRGDCWRSDTGVLWFDEMFAESFSGDR